MACLSKTHAALATMTASERKLAGLILNNPQVVLEGSAKAIGESCGISAASVVRFAQRLGFSSLKDMKTDLRNDLQQEETDALPAEAIPAMPLNETASHFGNIIASGMQAMVDMQSISDWNRAIQMICEARTIYLYGFIASSYPALDLQHKLVRMNKRAVFRGDRQLGVLDAQHMIKEDLIIAFSYSGEVEEVNEPVREAVKRGVNCIAVTRFGRSQLANMATLTLPLPENDPLLSRYAAVQSKYAQMLIADMLYVGYVNSIGKSPDDLFKK